MHILCVVQVFLYQHFQESEDSPKRLKMEVVRKAFPFMSESVSRKILKTCADFKREGEWVSETATCNCTHCPGLLQAMRMVGGSCVQTSGCRLRRN